jgi:hypothetical protein
MLRVRRLLCSHLPKTKGVVIRMSVPLNPDETLIAEVLLPASPFAKSRFVLTNKRLIVHARRTFLGLFALGTSDTTYPLANVASVALATQFRLGLFLLALLGLILGVVGLAHGWGLVLLLLGLWFGVLSFGAGIAVTNNAGQRITHGVWFYGRSAAQAFVQQINAAIAARS